jgi:hypothetical protein
MHYLCTVKQQNTQEKMMKKIMTLMMAFAIAMPAVAQFGGSRKLKDRFNHSNVEQYYGIRIGYNLAAINSSNALVDMDSYGGFTFGGFYGIQLANDMPMWLEAGLTYSEKGGKNNLFVTQTTNKDQDGRTIVTKEYTQKKTTRLIYLQVPIVVKYSFDVLDDFYIQPFLGGYLGLGIGGKTKLYDDRKSYDSFDDFNRLDGGLRIGCGFEYQMLYAEAGFDFGLANIYDDDFTSARNQNLFINIGVNF